MEKFIVENDLATVLSESGLSISEVSRRSSIKRQTIINIRDDISYNVMLTKAYVISQTLNEPFDRIFKVRRNPRFFERNFSEVNLRILEKYVESSGLSFTYQVYSSKCKVNVYTKYEMKRRVSFSGNLLIDLSSVPKLVIVDFDLTKRDRYIPDSELVSIFDKLLHAMVLFARDINLVEVELRLLANNLELNTPNISFSKLSQMVSPDDEINLYLLLAYKEAYQQGFRLSYFATPYRTKWHDIFMKKRIHFQKD
ncbi:hypothetical protein [Levilactobacillus yonginensis]|uniref:hypothetical protein n=1 Tax=Levilactobacillus yonginensis TaxID=1054041 RepID=UPI00345D7BAC